MLELPQRAQVHRGHGGRVYPSSSSSRVWKPLLAPILNLPSAQTILHLLLAHLDPGNNWDLGELHMARGLPLEGNHTAGSGLEEGSLHLLAGNRMELPVVGIGWDQAGIWNLGRCLDHLAGGGSPGSWTCLLV